ncbi:ACE1 transcriptional factor [Mycena venus]|uniref:ACE1 transcriptional factor n=1 Tax=Mycena venus TaxID=2733690 RepID=A0A8H6XK96_9AGAR|nr:ACE1 transcriptional factor [Mycena venus]
MHKGSPLVRLQAHRPASFFEIKKKGRPVTQCEHCRELRKTKQVHVKCICEAKEPPPPSAAPKKKGTPTLPAHAAFPHGVPDAGSATTSDSDHGGSTKSASASGSGGCSCKTTGGACNCCTPRTRPGAGARRRSEPPRPTGLSAPPTTSPTLSSPTNSNLNIVASPVVPATPHPTPLPSPNPNPNGTGSGGAILPARPPSHHILARIAELRPVLPRLSARDAALMQAGQHDLFHHSPGHPHHHQSCHGEHFSPYGRAYEHALMHPADYSSDASTSSAGFYQQDARSVESLLSVGSLASVTSHRSAASQPSAVGRSQKSVTQKSLSQKSHSQKSPSYDGNANGIFGNASTNSNSNEVDWRLPPSLSRSSASYTAASNSESYDNASAAFAPRPRSEGDEGYTLNNAAADATAAAWAPRPRSEAAAAHPRSGSDPSPLAADVRTCGSPTKANDGGRQCADPAQCGGACLDCTILQLPDFAAVVGFGAGAGGPGAVYNKEGYRFSNDNDKTEEDYRFDNNDGVPLALDGYAADDATALAYRKSYSNADLDLGELDGYNRDLGELELEGYDLDLAQEGYDLDLGRDMNIDALEQQRQSAAIDEWIREVGALPPPQTPFDAFEHASHAFEGHDANPNPNPNLNATANGPSSAKVEFDGMEFDVGQAWMFDVGGASEGPDGNSDAIQMPVPMQGLTGADVSMPQGGAFLTVPGPVAGAHGRSRSSSSASSEVSIPGASASIGVGLGLSAGGVGGVSVVGAALGVAVPALDPHPLHTTSTSTGMNMSSSSPPPPVPVPALLYPPPLPAGYMDDSMLFF